MPKIRMTENDLTGSIVKAASENVVYIPLISDRAFEPTLFKTVEEFNAFIKETEKITVGKTSSTDGYELDLPRIDEVHNYYYNSEINDSVAESVLKGAEEFMEKKILGCNLVRYLIKNFGYYVLAQGLGTKSTIDLNSILTEKIVCTDKKNYITSVSEEDWKKLLDKNAYNLKFLTTGVLDTDPSNIPAYYACLRGDCVALIDHKKDITVTDSYAATVRTTIETAFAESEYEGTWLKKYKDSYRSYGSVMTPWFKTENEELIINKSVNMYYEDATDPDHKKIAESAILEIKNEKPIIPASFGYLFAYGRMIKNNPEWYAAAGADGNRGLITEMLEPLHAYSNAECEMLQARCSNGECELGGSFTTTEGTTEITKVDNQGIAINPLAYIRPYGYLVWGNRTLLDNQPVNGEVILKATSLLNIRIMGCIIKKTVYDAARKYTFDQNSDVLWINFSGDITPLLDKIKSSNGILGYSFKKVVTDKKARLTSKLNLVPIEPVEDFDIELNFLDSLTVNEG